MIKLIIKCLNEKLTFVESRFTSCQKNYFLRDNKNMETSKLKGSVLVYDPLPPPINGTVGVGPCPFLKWRVT